MSKMKQALAMIAAGGAAGLATQASATTVSLNIAATDPLTPITLVGADPEYSYGAHVVIPDKSVFYGSTSAKVSGPFYSAGLPSASETVNGGEYKTVKNGDLQQDPTDFYLHLKFLDGGVNYVGTANFDKAATLVSIDYSVAAVPEPETWALLIGGMGLAGVGLRRQRRCAQSATA